MCTVCGCGHGEAAIDGAPVHDHDHRHDHTPGHRDDHGAHGHGAHGHGHSHGHGHQHSETGRVIALQQDILAKNAAFAMVNRRVLAEGGVLAINLMSSPGSGKTTLLEVTVKALARECPVAVIEGDQQTAHDAERIRTAGAPAIQINTGKGCHLDAHMVGHAIDHLGIQGGVLFIENVGNLVCPAAFDLGESKRVVILSVTEGDDKPLKYPDIFARADLLILTKSDLLPYVDFDPERCIDCARRINPNVSVFRLSARTGEGVAPWLDWVRACLQDQATR